MILAVRAISITCLIVAPEPIIVNTKGPSPRVFEIESTADYHPRHISCPANVWRSIAEIKDLHAGNITHVHYAQALIRREERRDFQRRCCVNE